MFLVDDNDDDDDNDQQEKRGEFFFFFLRIRRCVNYVFHGCRQWQINQFIQFI